MFLKISSHAAGLICLFIVLNGQAQERPNVVLIIADDMGFGDLESNGATDIGTPSIDSIALEGVRMTDFYSNAVLCSPTRAALITGRYQQRYNVEGPFGNNIEEFGLISTGDSLPQLLKNNGYATALVGKWHIGGAPESSPTAHGFDYFFGFKAGYIDYYFHDRGPNNPDLWENETQITEEGYMTDLITEHTIEFIEQNATQPFFIDVSYNAPHWPYQRPDQLSRARENARPMKPDSEDTSTREDYISMVERMDQGVGDILATLERLGLTENTIVIFTSDNGGEWLARNDPFSNRKETVWEGGIRVPALIQWPGQIPAGIVSNQVGITMDLTASIIEATGSQLPTDLNLDGINLFPILSEEVSEVDRTLYWRSSYGNRNQRAVRDGDLKLLIEDSHVFVFNLAEDPGEHDDLANESQDVARRLRLMHDNWAMTVTAEAEARGLLSTDQ
ncbi:MAG: sulfatase-like hydrolase/transferase [Gammaproteobacteria bacterium]|jgi:arylsulfatase A-like enzyme|nr:sulfatase-like hydrolase/transferase [Gammaproteobacteria bacterium]